MNDDLDVGETLRGFRAGQQVFNRYELVRMLGQGGMGVVWLAKDAKLERQVALKFLPEVLAKDPEAVADLKRETRRALELTHTNIVRIYDFMEDARYAAISMEYVEGISLSAMKLEQPNRHLEVAELKRWVEQLCSALEYAHKKAKVVHRDLKPANLMIDTEGTLKVMDFGISATLTDTTTRVSRHAGSSGTPVYMSPQQMMGKKPSATDDVYSLGATLYELLTGKPPFYTGNILMQVQGIEAPSMSERRAELEVSGEEIPAAWEETIKTCLAKEAAQRPQSVGEAWARLNGVAAPDSFHGRAMPLAEPLPMSNPPSVSSTSELRCSKKAPLVLAALAACILVGALGYYYGVSVPARERAEAQRRESDERVAAAERDRLARKAAAKAEQERVAATIERERQAEVLRREAAQRAEAQRLASQRPQVGTAYTVRGLNMAMMPISAGTFQMGNDKYENEKPRHTVQITKPFWLEHFK